LLVCFVRTLGNRQENQRTCLNEGFFYHFSFRVRMQ
jgi:hypothetical protein